MVESVGRILLAKRTTGLTLCAAFGGPSYGPRTAGSKKSRRSWTKLPPPSRLSGKGCEGWPTTECVRKTYSPHSVSLSKIGQSMKIYVDQNKTWLPKSVAVYTEW